MPPNVMTDGQAHLFNFKMDLNKASEVNLMKARIPVTFKRDNVSRALKRVV